MIQISGLIKMATATLSISVPVSDYDYTTVDGEDVRQFLAVRTIQAATDPTQGKQMERIFGGSISAGDIMLISEDTLYLSDAHTVGGSQKQSIIIYGGLPYRVSNKAEWTEQVGVNVYLCKRHLSQDALVEE